MLGCQDFCGYYDWTFHHVRQHFGQEAVARLWAEAIGGESQEHYRQAAQQAGLRGLYDTWNHTGDDEACVWSLTINEPANVLRIDMRECPSKGFLQQHNLAHDEDYCDHCIGWTAPLLGGVGIEVTGHEHNHCGQCWWEMRVIDQPKPSYEIASDIRRDPRWNHGYLDQFVEHRKLPLLETAMKATDSVELLRRWFARDPGASEPGANDPGTNDSVAKDHGADDIVTDRRYVDTSIAPRGVLIDRTPGDLAPLAKRFLAQPPANRPLLMHTYLPADAPIDFVSAGLPRPVPILPLLIRTGVYVHRPHQPPPASGDFLRMLVAAVSLLGIAD
jgi:hypothetical protein